MHCDMLKIQDGGAIVEKLNCDWLKTREVQRYFITDELLCHHDIFDILNLGKCRKFCLNILMKRTCERNNIAHSKVLLMLRWLPTVWYSL